MNEGTKLVELCVGRHEGLKASFTLSNGDSMLVDDLSGKDEAGWEEFVKAKGGPWELVAGWLQKHQLWRLLRDYESPNSKRPHLSVREGRETDSCLLCSPLGIQISSIGSVHYIILLFTSHLYRGVSL